MFLSGIFLGLGSFQRAHFAPAERAYLGGTFCGLSFLGYAQSPPVERTYATISVYGNAIIDKLNVLSDELTNAELLAIDITDTLTWSADTLALAEFENTLDAGNIVNLTSPITSWGVTRREYGSTTLTALSTVDDLILEYTDYLAQGNKNYEYIIYPQTATQIGQALQTSAILADFYGIYLIDETSETVLFFDLNVVTNAINNDTDMTEFENYTQYNAFAFGERDFSRGTIQAVGGYIDSTTKLHVNTLAYLDSLKSIINNKTSKILKFRDGRMMRVMTSNFKHTYMDEIAEQPYTFTFDYVQSGDV